MLLWLWWQPPRMISWRGEWVVKVVLSLFGSGVLRWRARDPAMISWLAARLQLLLEGPSDPQAN
jgi:hypothetical protein